MSNGQCLITGCDFLDEAQNRWVHGDLHQFFDCLIFNYAGCQWQHNATENLNAEEKIVKCPNFFEKNNLLIFPLALSQFNLTANAYLTEMMAKEAKRIITFGSGTLQ